MTIDPKEAVRLSFLEHMQTCDVCTLTWSDDFCDDFKLFLSEYPIVVKPAKTPIYYIKDRIECEGMLLGWIYDVVIAQEQTHDVMELIERYAKDLVIE